jgi:toxin ParE1/3/4
VRLSVHPAATRDLTDAFLFYKREAGPRVAARFLTEFERVAKLLHEFPDLGTQTSQDRRTYPLTGFPYSVVYRRTDVELRLLVVRHQNRDPAFGKHRS